MHFFFVLLNYRALGKLQKKVERRFPGASDQLWGAFSFIERADILMGSVGFQHRAALLHLAVAHPERLPVYILGDDEIAHLIKALNRKRSAGLYRWVSEAAGFRS